MLFNFFFITRLDNSLAHSKLQFKCCLGIKQAEARTCDKQKVGLDSHFSASVSLPKVRSAQEWSFVRKPGSESEFFICFCFVLSVVCLFVLSRALKLSNKLYIEIYLNIIVNGSERSRTFDGWDFAHELLLRSFPTFPVVNSLCLL